MIKQYGEVVVSDNVMDFIYNSFRPIFRLTNGWLKINQEDFLKNIEWSAKIYHNIQQLIEKVKENHNLYKYIIVDGGSKLILIFPDKYEVRFIQVVIDENFCSELKENLIIENRKENYYSQLLFMHTKSVDNMLYDFCLA